MNWQQTISDLQRSGLTQAEIAKSCGCAQSTISEIQNDEKRVPSYPIGAALLELHKKISRRQARSKAVA
jgi:transcriptional regulator with XRE-family HTH domain